MSNRKKEKKAKGIAEDIAEKLRYLSVPGTDYSHLVMRLEQISGRTAMAIDGMEKQWSQEEIDALEDAGEGIEVNKVAVDSMNHTLEQITSDLRGDIPGIIVAVLAKGRIVYMPNGNIAWIVQMGFTLPCNRADLLRRGVIIEIGDSDKLVRRSKNLS